MTKNKDMLCFCVLAFRNTLTWKRHHLERADQGSFQGRKQTQRVLVHYLGCEALPGQVFGRYENSWTDSRKTHKEISLAGLFS